VVGKKNERRKRKKLPPRPIGHPSFGEGGDTQKKDERENVISSHEEESDKSDHKAAVSELRDSRFVVALIRLFGYFS
jgi:hypothetical protein